MPTADRFEWSQGNPLFEAMFRAVSEGLFGNGILSSEDFLVTDGSGNLDVDVDPGKLWYGSSVEEVTTITTLTLSEGNSSDRWDTILYNADSGSVEVKEGTPEEYPEPSAVEGNESPLAFVYVPEGATAISRANILNWRPWATVAENIYYDDTTTVKEAIDSAGMGEHGNDSHTENYYSEGDDASFSSASVSNSPSSDTDVARKSETDSLSADIDSVSTDVNNLSNDVDSLSNDVSSKVDQSNFPDLQIDGQTVDETDTLNFIPE